MSTSERIAVCALTFHRPQGLRDLLASLAALAVPPATELEIVVVNNDPDDPEPARLCAEARAACPHPIALLAEAQRGLAAPRNRALEHALAGHDLLAFIDDDSTAEPGWLDALVEALRRTDADAVTGPVLPRFEAPPPAWFLRGGFLKPRSCATGTIMSSAYTNNVLVRVATLRRLGLRFDERFGLIGGEDVHFFRRFREAGGSIAWAAEARVTDTVPAERATAGWLVMRSRRTGMTTARIELDLRPRAVAAASIVARSVASTALGAGLLLAGLLGGRALRVKARCWLAWGRGLALGLAGRTLPEYLLHR